MKKKMLFMAAIAGLVSLGSCVKDDVSASVEAVRNAKANELNALANEHNANAAYTTAITAADVAFRQAETAHEQADAKAQELLNENQAMANQMRAANLEAEIAADLADYEAATALAKQQVQQRMNALETAMRAAATNKATDIMNAVTAYNTAYGKYLGAQKNVIAAQIRLETAKNDAENAKAIAETTIQSFDSQIAAQKELIAQLEEVSSTGMTAAEAQAAVKVLDAQINKAVTEFNGSDEVKALIEAGQELAEAYLALGLSEAFTFGAVNALIIDEFWYDANTDGVVDENDDPQVKYQAWWPTTGTKWDNYFYSSGTENLNAKKINFYDMTKYQMEYTTDKYDKNGVYMTEPGYLGPDGVKDSDPAPKAYGQTVLNGLTSIPVKQYVVSKQIKSAADEYFKNYSANLKADLDQLKKDSADYVAKLGTPSDAATKKYKDQYDVEDFTDYAYLNDAKAKLTKAIATYNTAKTDKETLPGKVVEAYKAMYPIYDKATPVAKDQAKALYAFAKAVEAAYGESANNKVPASVDYTDTDDQDHIAAYLFGNGAKKFSDIDQLGELQDLLMSGSALFNGALATGTFDDTKIDTYFENVTTAKGRKTVGTDVYSKFTKAETALGVDDDPTTYPFNEATGAYADVKTYTDAIFGTFDADHKLVANGTLQKIAKNKDDIEKKLADIATSEETVETYNAAVAGADVDAYDTAAADVAEAVDAYKKAAAAVQALIDEIDEMGNEQAALKAVVANDLEAQIKAAKDDLANLEKQKANWNNGITGTGAGTTFDDPEAIIAAAEADLVDAQSRLVAAAADLAAAQSALEALVGELDFDFDDEPAEEPETPEEPAEGGEGEGGEAEGGEGEAEGEGGEA